MWKRFSYRDLLYAVPRKFERNRSFQRSLGIVERDLNAPRRFSHSAHQPAHRVDIFGERDLDAALGDVLDGELVAFENVVQNPVESMHRIDEIRAIVVNHYGREGNEEILSCKEFNLVCGGFTSEHLRKVEAVYAALA